MWYLNRPKCWLFVFLGVQVKSWSGCRMAVSTRVYIKSNDCVECRCLLSWMFSTCFTTLKLYQNLTCHQSDVLPTSIDTPHSVGVNTPTYHCWNTRDVPGHAATLDTSCMYYQEGGDLPNWSDYVNKWQYCVWQLLVATTLCYSSS